MRLFAILRERAGRDAVEVDLDEDTTVAGALSKLSEMPELAGILGRLPVTMAVNREYATPGTRISAGDELALIPPVSGGAGVQARVTEEPLSLEALARTVSRRRTGAIVTFQGVTREVTRLDYEAYREMAERRIAEILEDCAARHGLEAIAAEHRIGPVGLGEASVIIAASAPHREEAFAGAREAIDRIKAEAPIWKREEKPDGTTAWVEGERPPVPPGPRKREPAR